ncbi:hypothetical protein [Embleya sp. NBC_00896]|uniref:hypothetical protein n=1 Tax=Embleya sp. NBC_00896 TaxID=2975961 RepID=UPI00386EE8E3|nr:hypothetical protein OG928_00160 [Embleya sp. NBC_00896]
MELQPIADTLAAWPAAFATPDDADRVPPAWAPIAEAADPAERVRVALARWNDGFLDFVPKFAAALRTRCADVRVAFTGAEPVLVYVLEGPDGGPVSWVGHHPTAFEQPPFWDECFPAPVQDFLREVHAGFASQAPTSYGIAPPALMATLADLAGLPEGIPDWDEDADIASTRLLRVCGDSGSLDYCLSPDLPVGEVALVYQGDIDPQDFGAALDELMTRRLEP